MSIFKSLRRFLISGSKKSVIIALCLFLTACLKTPITPLEIDETVRQLALSSDETIHIRIESESTPQVLGHQYLFVALPFGRVVVDDMEQYIFDGLFTALSLSGKKPVLQHSETPQYPSLVLRPRYAQATAYDFFAMRWIKTKLVIEAEYASGPEQKLVREFSADSSAVKRFAFSKQLSFYFNKSSKTLFADIANFTTPRGSGFESRY